jgi:hypothetical protein
MCRAHVSRIKTCGKSEFDIFEAKKRFPDSGKACILKRKVAKMRFLRLFTSIHRPFLDQGNIFSKFLKIFAPLVTIGGTEGKIKKIKTPCT